MPEPADKHSIRRGPAERYETDRPWNWTEWKGWLQRVWDRQHWRKKAVQKLLQRRAAAHSNQGVSWENASQHFNDVGWIYVVFHTTSGRYYVGQTVNTIWERLQKHWWSQKEKEDLFHLALRDDNNPYCLIGLPLQWIPPHQWKKRGYSRNKEVQCFRDVATPIEKWWVQHLDSLWPRGWNSVIPGKPIGAWAARKVEAGPQPDPSGATQEPGEWTEEDWLQQWQTNRQAALTGLKKQPKAQLRTLLHRLQTDLQGDGEAVNTLIDLLRDRRSKAPKRQFLRFNF